MIVLYHLGGSEEGNTLTKIEFLFGIGDRGTIDKIMKRVFTAILRLKDQLLFWPDAFEREKICQETAHELPNCVGYVDGSEIKLAERPFVDYELFFFFAKTRLLCKNPSHL